MSDKSDTRQTMSRRTALLTTGAVLGGISVGASPPHDTTAPASDTAATATPTVTYKLGADAGGWMGQSPSSIDGVTNPTLTMTAGNTYKVTYENLDGVTHDFQILDTGGTVLVDGADVPSSGDTNSVQFTATSDMTDYRCSFHPTSMAGSITIESTPTPTATETPTPTATETPTPTATETPTPTATETPTASPTPTTVASTQTQTPTETAATETVTTTPGFGVRVAVVSLLAKIALERRGD